MSVGILALNTLVDARIRAVLPAGIEMVTGYSYEDLTDSAPAILARIVPQGVYPAEQSGRTAALVAQYTLFVEFDQERLSTADESAGYQFFDDALAQIAGWAYAPGRFAQFIHSPTPMAYDGRIWRVEFSFSVPVFVTGNT
ncbi:hypothetical protein [Denitromonas halophila]|uniref:DUF3168 domain-containing protein n=1 Tax=Denitromonas halophila TaxID=1629404 RepID=A0A557QLS4_9RHOO|nr:hypothetical protein [Denitromonas halophila]TVO53855.1 hypothetical protein FHP91_13745 [Denitromonas halophila]